MMVAYFGHQPRSVCLFANQQFAEVFGLDEQSIVGMSPRDVVGEDLVEEVNLHVRRLLHERTPVTFTCEVDTGTGAPRWVEVSLSLATRSWPASSEKGLFFLLTDITQRRQAELALRESEDRLSPLHECQRRGRDLPRRRPDHRRQPVGQPLVRNAGARAAGSVRAGPGAARVPSARSRR